MISYVRRKVKAITSNRKYAPYNTIKGMFPKGGLHLVATTLLKEVNKACATYEKATGIGQVSTRSGKTGDGETDQDSGDDSQKPSPLSQTKDVKPQESEVALTEWSNEVNELITGITDKDWINSPGQN